MVPTGMGLYLLYHVRGIRNICEVWQMNREKAKDIINKIGDLENTYCGSCTRFSGESTKETLCITQCEIGKQIRKLGKKL